MATYIGHKQKGFWGSVFATLGVVLPSLIIIFAISMFFEAFMQNKYVNYAFTGIKAAVAFLISKTGIEIKKLLRDLNAEGQTIVLITHDNSMAEEAKRIVRIADGKLYEYERNTGN